jgi:hypothetical protein
MRLLGRERQEQGVEDAWKLKGTDFENVSVCPDLTRKQREEEADMRKEAVRRNAKELTDDDLAKNLRWAAVGDRGQRFLVKTTARVPRTGGRGGRRTGERQSRPTAPATRGTRGMIRGGRYEKQSRPATVRRTEKDQRRLKSRRRRWRRRKRWRWRTAGGRGKRERTGTQVEQWRSRRRNAISFISFMNEI